MTQRRRPLWLGLAACVTVGVLAMTVLAPGSGAGADRVSKPCPTQHLPAPATSHRHPKPHPARSTCPTPALSQTRASSARVPSALDTPWNPTSLPASPTTQTLGARTPSAPPATPSTLGDAATETSSPANVLEIAAQPSSGTRDSVALAGVIFALVVAVSVMVVVSGYRKRGAALGPAERHDPAHRHAARHRRHDSSASGQFHAPQRRPVTHSRRFASSQCVPNCAPSSHASVASAIYPLARPGSSSGLEKFTHPGPRATRTQSAGSHRRLPSRGALSHLGHP
jgi:hypothetical protein